MHVKARTYRSRMTLSSGASSSMYNWSSRAYKKRPRGFFGIADNGFFWTEGDNLETAFEADDGDLCFVDEDDNDNDGEDDDNNSFEGEGEIKCHLNWILTIFGQGCARV